MGADYWVKDVNGEVRATKPLCNLALKEFNIVFAIAMRNKDLLVCNGLKS